MTDTESNTTRDKPVSGAESEMQPKQRRGRRQLLSAFYGSVGDEEGNAKTKNPADLDSAGFEADTHVQKALRNMPLNDLISRHGELVQEIRMLDSSMQTLVYENYNKFISATDTIRNMKDNIENMETEMKQLLGNIDAISNCSDQVNETLSGRREKIEKLTGIHSLLTKLQFLFDLPSRLTTSIELGAYQQAVKYYAQTAPILARHIHLPSLKKIRAEVEVIADGLKETLRLKIKDLKTPVIEATNNVELLLMMGEKVSDLQNLYLSSRKQRLSATLDSAEMILATVKKKNGLLKMRDGNANGDYMDSTSTSTEDMDVTDYTVYGFLEQLHSTAISDFLILFEHFSRLFLRSTTVSTAEKATASELWNACAKEITDRYFKVARAALGGGGNGCRFDGNGDGNGMRSIDILKALQVMHVTSANVHQYMPDTRFRDQSADVSQNTVHDCVKSAFDEFQNGLKKIVKSLSSPDTSDAKKKKKQKKDKDKDEDEANAMLGAVMKKTKQLISYLKPFSLPVSHTIRNEKEEGEGEGESHTIHTRNVTVNVTATDASDALSSIRPVLTDLVYVFFQKAFLYLDDVMCRNRNRNMDLEEDEDGEGGERSNDNSSSSSDAKSRMKDAEVSPRSILNLCKFAMEIERKGIADVLVILSGEFPVNEGQNMELLNASELIRRFRSTAKDLLSQYVEVRGRNISLMIRKSIETPNWLTSKEPRDVRIVMTLVIDEVKTMNDEVCNVFGDLVSQTVSRSSESGSSYSRKSHEPRYGHNASSRYGHTVNSNIERLFARKIEIFSTVEFNTVSIVTGVVKMFMKSFLECTRLCTFNKNGFQQVQLDAQYLRESLLEKVESASVLDMLVDETISSAAHRCEDPIPLDSTIVETIIRKKVTPE